ncbi:WXG100 family type VII secretion target [Saccharomonospora sp. NPDC006951]
MVLRYTGAVSETGGSAINYSQQIKQLFEDLMTRVKGIDSVNWSGQVREIFEDAQRQWNTEADSLNNANTEIGRLTQQASENAFAADARGGAMLA